MPAAKNEAACSGGRRPRRLAAGTPADSDTALSIFRHIRASVAPYKRVRRIEFGDLPKTISGKIRRVELRLL